jgi:hypothetical protein
MQSISFTIAAVLVQVVAGVAVLVTRMLEIEWGLPLALIRTTHIVGAAVLLASSTILAIQYRQGVNSGHSVAGSRPR